MVGAVVSIAALVLAFTGPVVVIGAPTTTEPDALHIEPFFQIEDLQFFLPLDAPLAEMPINGQCVESTVDWLTEHGVMRPISYLMSVRNNADDGPMLTIDNVRVVDKKTIAPRPGYLFQCHDGGNGETALLDLDLDRDGPAVLFDDENDVTGRPFAFNLEPGEEGSIDLRLLADTNGYSGRVVADVIGGATTRRIELALNDDGGAFERPGLGRSAGFLVKASESSRGMFTCTWSGNDSECDADTVRSMASELWE
jgi:hypothetical protein